MITDSSTRKYVEINVYTGKYWYYGTLSTPPDDAYISYSFELNVYAEDRHHLNPNLKIGRIVINANSNKTKSSYITADYDNYDAIFEDFKNVLSEIRTNYPEYYI